jgi:hypothetical protein
MDQYGSRFIQQKLDHASASDREKIFPEILSNTVALATDVFGNYVIQKVCLSFMSLMYDLYFQAVLTFGMSIHSFWSLLLRAN